MVPRVLMFNQPSSRDPYPLLKVVYEGLCSDSRMLLHGVIFCTDQLAEGAEEKLGMFPPYFYPAGLTLKT